VAFAYRLGGQDVCARQWAVIAVSGLVVGNRVQAGAVPFSDVRAGIADEGFGLGLPTLRG
jgi:hypothetical protein